MSDIRDLTVAIAVPTKKGQTGWSVGTGCSISDEFILTARHVLEDWDKQRSIRVYWKAGHATPDEEQIRVELGSDCIAWKGCEEHLDVALLRARRPSALSGKEHFVLALSRPGRDWEWSSRGYPDAAVGEGLFEPGDFSGKLLNPADHDFEAEVEVTSHPQREEDWSGASGMPISDGGTIFAVSVKAPRKFGGSRLKVVPTWLFCRNEAFAEVFCAEKIWLEASKAKIEADLSTVLGKQEKVCRLLGERFGIVPGISLETDLAKRILASKPQEWLHHLFQINFEPGHLLSESERRTIAELISVSLPGLLDEKMIEATHLISEKMTFGVVEVPVAIRTVAEVAMAAADGRPVRFRPAEKNTQDLAGEFHLPDLPESGGAGNDDQTRKDMYQTLEDLLEIDPTRFAEEFRGRLEGQFIFDPKMQKRLRPSSKASFRKDFINGRLETKLRNEGVHFYFAAVLPEDARRREESRRTLNALKQDFPLIVFLELGGDETRLLSEMNNFENVALILRDDERAASK